MIYLTTGGNGAGKTLFTLADVRAAQLKENRPVYYHGFEALQPIIDFGWLPFEPEKWQDLPDGSICIFDECQNEFPAKIQGALPEFINAIAQFRRKRGFDFYMITPHPSLINVNVRRLIESPSYHRHMKRSMGADMCSQLMFNFANMACERPNAGAAGTVTMRAFPKEVYSWYKSSSLHTGKKRIPKQVWVLLGCIVLIPLVGWFAWKSVFNLTNKAAPVAAAESPAGVPAGGPAHAVPDGPLSVADFIQTYQPRIAGLPHTAPRYDEVTKPTTAPFPAACVKMAARCECYTQQGTKLPTPGELCKQIVANGYFMDWNPAGSSPVGGVVPAPEASPAPAAPRTPLAGNPAASDAVRLGEPREAVSAAEVLKGKTAAADGAALALMRSGSRSVSSY